MPDLPRLGLRGWASLLAAVLAGLVALLQAMPSGDGATPNSAGHPWLDCLGPSVPLVVDRQMPYAQVQVGGRQGWFVLDFGATGSRITPAGFDSPPMPLPGRVEHYAPFRFFGDWGTVHLPLQPAAPQTDRVRQAGVLGTDILAQHTYALDYANGRLHRSLPGGGCGDAALSAAGFRALDSRQHYATHPSRLSCPDAGGPPNCVNVPTVPLHIGGVRAVAQLDTGYDDSRQPGSININPALLNALRNANVPLTPRPDIALQLSTCVPGVSERIEAWQPAAGVRVGLVDQAGQLLPRSAGPVTLFVKRTPPQAASCGGIGTWQRPAAQLGASFVAGGALVVDPGTGTVWLR